MSIAPQPTTKPPLSPPKRSKTVVMGQQDFLSVLLRSMSGELYKIRQRTMPKILLLITILIMFITFSAFALEALATAGPLPLRSCSSNSHGQYHCSSQQRLQDAVRQQASESLKAAISVPLRLPSSLSLSVSMLNYIGTISFIILTSSIVGGEYGIGTIRLMLTRGPTRTQFLLAKIGAVLICILATLLLLILVGIIMGALLNLTTGIAVNFRFFTGQWLAHTILYVLITALGIFVYAMIALSLATLGKTTAAGMAGALIWWFLEGVLEAVLTTFGSLNKGPVGDFLQSIPDYFIGNNISALRDHQNQYLMNEASQVASMTHTSRLSDVHASMVIGLYLVMFIGMAWWANQQRDITN